MTSVPRALLYVRISTNNARFNVGSSLATQLARCRAYVAANSWSIDGEYSGVMTGSRDNRPSYQALLEEARRLRGEDVPVVVVTASLDRLGRRMLESLRCRRELSELGVPLHSVTEGGEVPDIVANILAAVAQEEVQQLSRRVRAVRSHIIDQGWYLGHGGAWGYRWRPSTPDERAQLAPRSVIEPDPVAAPSVREMFRLAADGHTLTNLSAWIATLSLEARGGRGRRFMNIRRALRSPLYIGRSYQGDPDVLSRPIGRWEPLVSDDLWHRVQDRQASPLSPQASGRYLLTSLLRCHRCGGPAGGGAMNRGRLSYYHCDRMRCRRNIGPRHSLDTEVLKQARGVLGAVLPADSSLEAEIGRAWSDVLRTDPVVERRMQQLQSSLERGQRRLASAGRSLDAGDLDEGGYGLVREAVQSETEASRCELIARRPASNRRGFPSPDVLPGRMREWAEVLATGQVPQQREVLGMMVKRVNTSRVQRGDYTVRIEWTPLSEALRTLGRSQRASLKGRDGVV
jgi:DNA invertase Pin-like site-specific DNA recombinase